MNLSKRVEQKVIAFIDDKKLLVSNDNILIALSGGSDSVFLLSFLSKYSRRFSVTIGALHVNHKLRKKASSADAVFCSALCESMNIPFYLIEKDIKQIAKQKKMSLEEAGRMIRYEELDKISRIYKYSKIATAHITNDNTETVLLNLIKGTGIKGISGIPASRGKIIRPILGLTKYEIIAYLEQNKISFRTDKSNLKNQYERNFIRNELIPRIKMKLNPNLDSAVFRSSQVFRNYSGFLEEQLTRMNKLVSVEEDSLRIRISDLNKIDKRLAGDFFIYHIQNNFGIQLNYTDIIAVQKLVKGEVSKKINLTEGLSAIRDRGQIVFTIIKSKSSHPSEIEILKNQKKNVDGITIQIDELIRGDKYLFSGDNTEYLDGADLDERFFIRRWKAGDNFRPFGMYGTKKISDYLNELKISALEKKEKLVLVNRNRIIWVVGYRIDDRFRITPKTKKVIRLCLK